MSASNNWYMKDVFRWRTGASIAWAMLLLPPTATAYIFLATLNLFHPYQWLVDWLQSTFSISGIACVFLTLMCTAVVAFLNACFYTAIPHVHRNRLSVLLSVTRPTRLLHGLGHALLGGLITWSCCKLVGSRYVALTIQCSEDDSRLCLNEYHLFLVLFGAFLGGVYSVTYFLYRSNHLTFPLIQQVKFFQVKTNIALLLFSNSLWALRMSACYYLLYYLCGCLFKSWLLFNLNLHELPTPVDTIRGLLDVRLFWQTWMMGSLVIHLWKFSLYLFKVFNTEVYEFPIEHTFSADEACTLHRALEQVQNPLVQYLAYQDLSLLAEHSVKRRKQVFSLSQPGGHPHNWQRICMACLSLVASLTNRLRAHQENSANGIGREKRISSGDEKHSSPKQKQSTSSVSTYYTATSPAPYQRTALLSTATPSSARSDAHMAWGTPKTPVQSLSYSTLTPSHDNIWTESPAGGKYMPSPRKPIHQSHVGHFPQNMVTMSRPPLQVILMQPRLAAIRQWQFFRYFLDPFPEADNRALFTDAQLHIWALEALSSLVAASFYEDSYGVVQKSLPDILAEMLALHNALEKLLKLPTLMTARDPRELKVTRIGPAHPDDQLRNDLRTTVKTSLHRIVATFGKHLTSVHLNPEYRKQLTELMDYKL